MNTSSLSVHAESGILCRSSRPRCIVECVASPTTAHSPPHPLAALPPTSFPGASTSLHKSLPSSARSTVRYSRLYSLITPSSSLVVNVVPVAFHYQVQSATTASRQGVTYVYHGDSSTAFTEIADDFCLPSVFTARLVGRLDAPYPDGTVPRACSNEVVRSAAGGCPGNRGEGGGGGCRR
jgi:hypothetical protein